MQSWTKELNDYNSYEHELHLYSSHVSLFLFCRKGNTKSQVEGIISTTCTYAPANLWTRIITCYVIPCFVSTSIISILRW